MPESSSQKTRSVTHTLTARSGERTTGAGAVDGGATCSGAAGLTSADADATWLATSLETSRLLDLRSDTMLDMA